MSVEGRKILADSMANGCRLLLAVCFVFSGFVKAVDPVGTQIKLQDYFLAFGLDSISDSNTLLTACLLAGIEFLFGIYLLLGVYRRGTSVAVLVLMLIFTPLTLYLAVKNPVSDCGCFGDAIILTNWQTFGKNVVLLFAAVCLVVMHERVRPFISERRAWAVPLISVLLIGHFMISNLRYLPVFDFRPYKVGTDLRKGALEGAEDSFSDFALLDADMNDVTDSVLTAPGYTFLLIAPYLEEASQENIDVVNDLYYYCLANDYRMLCVTASSHDGIERWKDITFAEYNFLSADEIPLRTMVRANPGIVLLNAGVIVAKWNAGNVPIDLNFGEKLEHLVKSHPFLDSRLGRILNVTLYFILPYLLLLLIDMGRRRTERSKDGTIE